MLSHYDKILTSFFMFCQQPFEAWKLRSDIHVNNKILSKFILEVDN